MILTNIKKSYPANYPKGTGRKTIPFEEQRVQITTGVKRKHFNAVQKDIERVLRNYQD